MAKTRQKSERLVSFYFRLPADIREQIDDLAEKNNTSSARVATELLEVGLRVERAAEQTIHDITSDEAQAKADLAEHGREHISEWLKRN